MTDTRTDEDNVNHHQNVVSSSLPASSSDIALLRPQLSQCTFRVDGRIFIITGGTQGLGLSIATLLIEQGACGLILISRHHDKGIKVCNELMYPAKNNDDNNTTTNNQQKTCHCIHIATDLAIADDVLLIVSKAIEQLTIDHYEIPNYPINQPIIISGLINAAATSARGNLFTETYHGFDNHMNINVRAPFLLIQSLSKHMIEYKITNGSIVNIGSCASYGGAPFILSYTASKAACMTMTKTIAHTLASYNIRVNGINMGWCYTTHENSIQSIRTNTNWINDADHNVPIGRILRPHDVACTVLFLLSNASIMMTASIIELHPEYPYGMISLALNESDGR